jgi:hypothetical protein
LGKRLLALLRVFQRKRYPRKYTSLRRYPSAVSKHIAGTGLPPEILKKIVSGKKKYVYGGRGPKASIGTPYLWLVDPSAFKSIKVPVMKPSYQYRP